MGLAYASEPLSAMDIARELERLGICGTTRGWSALNFGTATCSRR
jgi:hypothetical protein